MNDTIQTIPRPRIRLRITLGGMMLLVLVTGGWLGWVARQARIQREAVAAIVKAGGNVVYGWDYRTEAEAPGPKWLREWIGVDYFDTVTGINANKPAVDDAVVAQIGRLRRVRFLGLQGSSVTDAGLVHLASLTELRVLHLRAANVNGSGLRHLSGLRQLYALHFNQTPITDDKLAYLLPLPALQKLGFYKTRITDAGMKHVAKLKGFQELWLENSDVGDEGLRELARIQRPIKVHVWPKTRITPEGIKAMKTLAPDMTVSP
jgi:internalin A